MAHALGRKDLRKMMHSANKHFGKMDALNTDIDAGGHIGMAAAKSKRKLQGAWENRGGKNIAGFFNHKEARAAKRAQV